MSLQSLCLRALVAHTLAMCTTRAVSCKSSIPSRWRAQLAAPPQPAAEKPLPEINSGLDAVKLAATDPKEWMRAREDYDKKVAEDMILEGGGELTREDAFKYLGVLVVSFVGGRVFKQGKDDEGA